MPHNPLHPICPDCGDPVERDGDYCEPCADDRTQTGNCTLKCYRTQTHGYHCDADGCTFEHHGLPTICTVCGSANITSGLALVDYYIKELQRKEAILADAA